MRVSQKSLTLLNKGRLPDCQKEAEFLGSEGVKGTEIRQRLLSQ